MQKLGPAVRAVSIAALCVALSGCVTAVTRPATPVGATSNAGPTYAAAASYVETVRINMEKKLSEFDNFEAGTKAGVGLGIAGAGTASVFHGTVHPILTFLTLGALSYTLNQAVDPKTLAPIYNAGLDNLDCIAGAGASANGQRLVVDQKGVEIDRLVQALRADIAAAHGNSNYDKLVEAANTAVDAGATVLADIHGFQAYNPVPDAMIQSTTRTVHAVNQQLRERSPSIEAISQSGGVFATFMASGASLRADAQAGADKVKAVGKGFSGDALNDRLTTDISNLKAALAGTSALMSPANATAVGACQAQFAALAPLTLLTPSPVELQAGGDKVWLEASGDKPFYLLWSKPAEVLTDADLHGVSLTATEKAAEHSYKFRLKDYAGHVSSDEYVLNVHPKPPPEKAPDDAAPAPAPGGAKAKVAPPKAPAAAPGKKLPAPGPRGH